jgi:tetratricopeptide (TPR) repeat protein
VAALALQQAPRSPQLTRAESLLVAGRLEPALSLAEPLARAHPDDPQALVVLGRIRLAWPVFGRWQAESLFTAAGTLDPGSPEPFYYLGQVGLRLGGDDGESVARRGLVRVLELNPEYRDAWQLWTMLYRGESERRGMVDVLARHAGDRSVDLWRSQLLVETRHYDEAQPVLLALARSDPDDPAPRAWLARSLFEQGREAEAARAYDEALNRAPVDTGEVLWRQVRSIATPLERETYARTPPSGREAFLRLFWAKRNPDLHSSVNPRIGEHFRRLAEAERFFALLHPQSRYHHSRARRTVLGGLGTPPGLDLDVIRSAIALTRQARVADEPGAAGVVPRLDAPEEETPNLEDGLDDRGRMLVRYGAPDERYVWNGDAETWRYVLPEGYLQVTFARRTADGGGDQVVTPVVAGEYEAAEYLLRTDRPGLKATLRFSFWPASFRGAGSRTELALFPDSVSATAVLFDAEGREAARDSATGRALHLTAPPGPYVLALDADRMGRLGRFRGTITLPAYRSDSLAVSSLLVGSDTVAAARPALEAAAPPGLRLPAQRPLRVYAEIYGLAASAGATRYDAVYRFERTGGGFLGLSPGHVTTISFSREAPPADPTVETLVIDPGRLPHGHYRLALEVRDVVRGTRAASATLEFDLR